MAGPGSGVANNLVEAFHHLPQEIIEGLLGQKLGGMVESGLGIPLGEPQQAAPPLDTSWHDHMVRNANRSFLQQQQQAKPPLKMNLRGR